MSSRRSFLCGVAGLMAPAVFPASVLGRTGTLPSEKITLAMIGMGRQAYKINLPTFLSHPHVEVVAVCDVDSWRLDNAKRRVDEHRAGCGAYRDFREVLARDDIDAVMISTPDHWHALMSVEAAKAGKHVCCEKPMTRTIEEGRIVADTMARYGRVFRVDSEFRSHGFFARACELVRNGCVGRLHTIRTGTPKGDVACDPQPPMPVPEELDYEMWLGPAPPAPYTLLRVHPRRGYGRPGWMRVMDYCDGMVTNWGTHLNDIAQWGHGTDRTGPVEIEATGTFPADGLWDVLLEMHAEYRFADGVRLIYSIDRPYVRFEGDEGWVEADYSSRRITAHPASLLDWKPGPGDLRLPVQDEKDDFIEAIRTGRTTLEDAEVGHRTTSLCLLALHSIQVGRPLRWDPEKEVFLDDPDANRLLSRPMRAPWGI